MVVPGVPHHITQRGNRRQKTFFCNDDYRLYTGIMSRMCFRFGVKIWAYCLMPNHVHLIAVPETSEALARAIGEAHRYYTCEINERENWKGYLWQGRFSSNPMGESHLLAATRYVERNPVRAGLVPHPWDWSWSSVRAHLGGKNDDLVTVGPLLAMVDNWAKFLGQEAVEAPLLRQHMRTGRPLGSNDFIEECERVVGRPLKPFRQRWKPGSDQDVNGSR